MTSAKGTVPMNNSNSSPHAFVDNHICLCIRKLGDMQSKVVPGVLCAPLCVIASLFFENVVLGSRMESRSCLLCASKGLLQ